MARIVGEIMNRELLAVRPETPTGEIRHLLKAFAVGAVPVLDEGRRPRGVVSSRDLLEGSEAAATDRMTRPARCIAFSTTVEDAARILASTEMHHLVVVDDSGAAMGMVSTIDVLRELVAAPTRHPAAFPHWDELTEASWSDDWPLEESSAGEFAETPGVIGVVRCRRGESDVLVWVESCSNLRRRIAALASSPPEQLPAALAGVPRSALRVRTASIRDPDHLARAVAVLRDRLAHLPPPGAT